MMMDPVYLLISGLIPLILIAGIVAACVTVLVRGLRLPRSLPANAACGNCRYQIAFTSAICPECGADLRQVGTATARTALYLRSSLFLLLLAWSVLALFGFGVAVTMWSSAASTGQSARSIDFTRHFLPYRDSDWNPDRGELVSDLPTYEIILSGNVDADFWKSCTLSIVPDEGPRVLVMLDMPGREWVMQGEGEPVSGKGFDENAVEQFFEAARIDTASDEIQNEIGQAANLLDLVATAGPDAANDQNWGLVDPFSLRWPTPPPTAPAMYTLQRGSVSTRGNTTNVEYEPWLRNGASLEVEVQAEYEAGDDRRPQTLTDLSLLIHTVGWPIRIVRDCSNETWAATRGEAQWGEGTIPASADDMAALLERIESETEIKSPPATASDLAALLNLKDDELIGFTAWSPPRNMSEPTHGLRSTGGGSSGGSVSLSRSVTNRPLLLLTGFFLLFWIVGLIGIVRRRRRLVAVPCAS